MSAQVPFQYTEDLEGYESLPESKSCYLDGRYFNKVFADYPGLLENPMHLDITVNRLTQRGRTEEKASFSVRLMESDIDESMPGLLRLVIHTHHRGRSSKHSNLLILDYQNGIIYRFEPLGENAPYFNEINNIVHTYLNQFLNFDFEVVDFKVDEELDEQNPDCTARGDKSGYCIAYIIKFAYDYLNGFEFEPANIRRFVTKIERTYGKLKEGNPDIEYGPDDGPSRGQKQAIGAGAGLLGGALLAGPVGALALGGTGLLAGSIL
jgi:hypothetical protein